MIIDGLPPGTTIELAPVNEDFICLDSPSHYPCSIPLSPGACEAQGGSLDGSGHCFESVLDLQVSGTGSLAGFNRHLAVPLFNEIHTGGRNPGDPVQAFPSGVYRQQGELYGDPDFCTFRFLAGTDYGLPSPGQTTLTHLGADTFNLESFFDITYQIEFEGCPGSQLDGYMGTTAATIRMQSGATPPTLQACCMAEGVCEDRAPELCAGGALGEGSICEGDGNEDGRADACEFLPENPCVVPDNGTGTITLPPQGCEYTSPNDVFRIVDGLPPSTTIELDPIQSDFDCSQQPTSSCSMPLSPGECETQWGSLDVSGHCFESVLDLQVSGTGSLAGFNRHLSVPLFNEIHTGGRNPGDPVQAFPADMYRLQGELFGDPDFCTFRMSGGSDKVLPSPGATALTDIGNGKFNVDSFFDVAYQIEFEGCPGSQLDGYYGITASTLRMQTGGPVPEPAAVAMGLSAIATLALLAAGRRGRPAPDGRRAGRSMT
jgi:hypothetical protein